MCEHLGPLPLFLTFTCDDISKMMKNAIGLQEPWKDPVMFALHFRQKWTKFSSEYVMKKWGKKIGGIRDWSYVMEIQGIIYFQIEIFFLKNFNFFF